MLETPLDHPVGLAIGRVTIMSMFTSYCYSKTKNLFLM